MLKTLAKKCLIAFPPYRNLLKRLDKMENERSYTQDQVYELRRALTQMSLPAKSDALHQMVACLQPMKVVGKKKVRVGCPADGGYVMLDDWPGAPLAQSLGIAGNVTWDLDIAGKGIPVHQFDYSIDRTPEPNPLFTFHKKKVESIADILSERKSGQLLKIDIEGSEWGFFDQIVGEFHDFDRFYDPAWQTVALRVLQKLHQTHQLIHVHGNNYGPAFWTGKLHLPICLELSYVRRDNHEFSPTEETFPGELDFPNAPEVADYDLNSLLRI